jgi:hypothetical protein
MSNWIVIADEAEAVESELEAALDRLEEKHTLFGGGIESVAFEHLGIRKKSGLAHTMDASGTAAAVVRNARMSVAVARRAVIWCRPAQAVVVQSKFTAQN